MRPLHLQILIGLAIILLIFFYNDSDKKTTKYFKQSYLAGFFDSSNITELEESSEDFSITEDESIEFLNSTNVSSCLPHYNLMKTILEAEEFKRQETRTDLLLLSAFEYSDHIGVTLQTVRWLGSKVYCRYLDASFEEVGPPTETWIVPESVAYCCSRDGVKYMSITEFKNGPIQEYRKLEKRMQTNEFKYELSLCLAPMYGNESKWLLLAETIEHYKLQGVQHFYLYLKDVDEYSRRVMDSYTLTGEAEQIVLEHQSDRPGAEWQLVGVQDCLLRSRYESRYSIFADLDERMLPLKGNLLDFSRKMFETANVGSLIIRPRWIFRDKPVPGIYKGTETLEKSLPTLIFHNTTHWAPAGHTTKCILDPLKVFVMWVHYPATFYPGYETKNVEPSDAIIRHYRDIQSGDWGNRWMPVVLKFGNTSNTKYPDKLMKKLFKNIRQRLDIVYYDSLDKS